MLPRVKKSPNPNTAHIFGDTTGSVTEAGVLPDGTAVPAESSASGQLTIADADPDQAAFLTPRASSMSGTYGKFTFAVATGDWTYRLYNTKAMNALAGGATAQENLVITSLDGQTSQTITVDVHGTNDAPTLTAGRVSGTLVEAGHGTSGSANATIIFTKADPDVGDKATWDRTGWEIDSDTMAHKLGTYGTAFLDTNPDTNKGVVRYVLDNSSSATNALKSGQKVLDSFAIKVHDDSDATKTVNADFSIIGTNDDPVLVALEGPLSYTKNTVAHYAVAELLGNVTDVDNLHSSLKIAGVKNGNGGTARLVGNEIIFKPTKDFEGDAHFSYLVTDGLAHSQYVSVTVSIPPPPDITPPDTTPPDAPVFTWVDSGVSGDLITNQRSYDVHGEDYGTFKYSTFSEDGPWLGEKPSIDSDGYHTIYVRQTDLAGNVSPPAALSFTLDTTPPTLTHSPADDAPIDIAGSMVLTFSEAVHAGTGDILIWHAVVNQESQITYSQAIPITDTSRVTISGSVVTIRTPEGLNPDTDYWISMDSGVLKDTAGNANVEILADPGHSFNALALSPINGTGGNDSINGTASSEIIVGRGGFDSIYGDAGNDLIIVPDLNFDTVDGGEGNDTLVLLGDDIYLEYRYFENPIYGNKINSIEVFDLTGSALTPTALNPTGTGANTLRLAAEEVFPLSGTSIPLRVNGDANDKVILTFYDDWVEVPNGATFNDVTYDVWSYRYNENFTATVLIEVGVQFQQHLNL